MILNFWFAFHLLWFGQTHLLKKKKVQIFSNIGDEEEEDADEPDSDPEEEG